jgi:transcriptional regulator with XRE-family HTH domain
MVDAARDTAKRLGADLRTIRQVRNLSLAAVSEPAKISAAYLQKLESGAVKNPSPRVLMRLAEVLECDYDRLMELAGYVAARKPKSSGERATFLEAALRNEQLTDSEQRAVLAFVAYLKGLRSEEPS